jgi:DNA-binding LacI/PurR family transcriptional regulator
MTTVDGVGRRPTIYDVAERAGVSKSLVSLVVAGSTQVSEKRRAAVLSAIAELGYRPSQAATILASARTRNIEVLIDDYRNLSFVGLVHGVRDGLADHDYYVTLTETQPHNSPSAGRRYRPATPADGRILAAEPRAADLAGWNGPTVVAGLRETAPDGADLVASDDDLGARLACEHLLGLGHRRFGHLTGSGGPAHHRRAGFHGAMSAARLRGHIAGENGGTTEQDGYRTAAELLDRYPRITAIVAANDVMALGALAAIREHGRSVPGDISLVGYDNSPLAQSRYLSLTSVDDRSAAVGAAAASALLARIEDPTGPAIRAMIEPALVVRGTTAKPRLGDL